MSGIRYSSALRQRAISLVLDSHLPITQVAQDIGCSVSGLNLWLRKHRQQNDSPTDFPNKPAFLPVNVIDSLSPPVEIIIPNGITIRLSDASPAYIAELLHAIAPC